MARVIDSLTDDERHTPILSSPRLGMERMRDLLAGPA
jgi:hypothetical protein